MILAIISWKQGEENIFLQATRQNALREQYAKQSIEAAESQQMPALFLTR